MYIIACRAHFCHLLGLGQVGHSLRETSGSDRTLNRGPCCLGEVGHSPRGTSGSAGTLDWGPMWSDSQSTCHLQCTPTPLMSPTPQCPYTPEAPNAPDAALTLLAPEYLHSLPAPNAPLTAQCPPTPYTP